MDADFDKEEPDEGYAQVCAHVFSSKHYDESVDIPSGKNAEAIAKEQKVPNEFYTHCQRAKKDNKLQRASKTSSKEFGKTTLKIENS